MNKALTFTLGTLALLGSATGVWHLHRTTMRLQTRANELRRAVEERSQKSEAEREENHRLRLIADQTKRGDPAATAAVHAELDRARKQQSELEDRAKVLFETHAQRVAESAKQHDPEKGLVRLEDLQNVGRQTPVSALQTLIWAVMKNESSELTAGISLSPGAREQIAQLLNGLPEAARERYPTLESLAALVVTDNVLQTAAIQVMGSTATDAEHAVVSLRRLEAGDQILRIPLQLGEGGWQVVINEKEIVQLKQRISAPQPN